MVICDDGSVWYQLTNGEWEETTPIPGTKRDKEKTNDSSRHI